MTIIKTGDGKLYVIKGSELFWVDGPTMFKVTEPIFSKAVDLGATGGVRTKGQPLGEQAHKDKP